jgi:broad specificity phosphatase PhoE
MDLFLARHGESEWIVRGDQAGFNSPLTERGRQQARLLGRWLAANQKIDAIYASPLIRAKETAEIVAAELNLPLALDDDLREFEVPYWRDSDDYDPPYINGSAPPTYLPESYLPFKARVQGAVRRILEAHPQGTVLIVAHGGTLGTIVRCLLGAHNFGVQTDPTGLHRLRWDGSRWTIEFMNRLDHLLAATSSYSAERS